MAVGLEPEAVASGIAALDGVPGRMERIDRGQPFAVVVDYAHTDVALENLLRSLRGLGPRRLLVVFGCGGDRDRGKREAMGRVAAEHADAIFLTSDNPRDEDPQVILDGIAAGVARVPGAPERCLTIPDRRAAIHAAIAEAGSGDVVALAGKGHETTLVTGDRAEPFDDRIVAAEALAQRAGAGGDRAGA